MSHSDLRLHFGLGSQASIDSLEISWPSGKKDSYHNLAADFIYTISEDGTIQKKIPFTKPRE